MVREVSLDLRLDIRRLRAILMAILMYVFGIWSVRNLTVLIQCTVNRHLLSSRHIWGY